MALKEGRSQRPLLAASGCAVVTLHVARTSVVFAMKHLTHAGYDCDQYQIYKFADHCRFCDRALMADVIADFPYDACSALEAGL